MTPGDYAAQMMIEARKFFVLGRLREAGILARHAGKLHGPYDAGDVGERPADLLHEIRQCEQNQKEKMRNAGLIDPVPSGQEESNTPIPAATLAPTTVTDAEKIRSKIYILMYEGNARADMANAKMIEPSTRAERARLENATMRDRKEITALWNLSSKAYKDVIAMDPRHLPAYQGLMHVYLKLGQNDRAQETIDKALAVAPRNPNLLYDQAICYCQRKEWKMAQVSLRNALAIDPENSKFKKQLGFTLALDGNFDKSVEVLSQANPAIPGYGDYMVAKVLIGVFAQDALSKKYLLRALQANPELEEARELLDEIERRICPD